MLLGLVVAHHQHHHIRLLRQGERPRDPRRVAAGDVNPLGHRGGALGVGGRDGLRDGGPAVRGPPVALLVPGVVRQEPTGGHALGPQHRHLPPRSDGQHRLTRLVRIVLQQHEALQRGLKLNLLMQSGIHGLQSDLAPFRSILRVEPAPLEMGSQSSLRCLGHRGLRGQVLSHGGHQAGVEQGGAHFDVGAIVDGHGRRGGVARSVHRRPAQVVDRTTVRGHEGVFLPHPTHHLVENKVVGTAGGSVQGIVGAHHSHWLRLKGQGVLPQVRVPHVVGGDFVVVVATVGLHGIPGVVLEEGQHLRVPCCIPLLHPRHHLIRIQSAVHRVLPGQLTSPPKPGIPQNIDVRPVPRERHKIPRIASVPP
mmetsp:Transcript_54220/g.124336  ORF Transcript_54220/g.124336 Transcript_54220/m.124336 type:complete len:365 (-) Transcript_54220:774-1868(-)